MTCNVERVFRRGADGFGVRRLAARCNAREFDRHDSGRGPFEDSDNRRYRRPPARCITRDDLIANADIFDCLETSSRSDRCSSNKATRLSCNRINPAAIADWARIVFGPCGRTALVPLQPNVSPVNATSLGFLNPQALNT